MAEETDKSNKAEGESLGSSEPTEAQKNKARQWFRKAEDLRKRLNYDYAIESYITGMGFWPDAIEEGYLPLWALAVQRQQAGGKKPGKIEEVKRTMSSREPRQAMLNWLSLLARDPSNERYADNFLKAANKAGLNRVVVWAAERVLESLRKEKKPNAARHKQYRQELAEAAQRADEQGDAPTAVALYEHAVQSVEIQMARKPGDMALRDEQRDLAGKLTIAKGKYAEADSFRESLRDAEKQKVLHDTERTQQAEQTLEQVIASARREYEENPTFAPKINAYVAVLLKTEQEEYENEAIRVLEKTAERLNNYSFKARADDVRLRRLARRTRALRKQAEASGSDEDRQQLRLAMHDELQTAAEIYRERIAKYPTDMRLKAKLGEILVRLKRYDDAIPLLQAGQNDPRSRPRCQLLMGQAFAAKGDPAQAADILREALEKYDRGMDDLGKAIMYHLGLALEADGRAEEAQAVLAKLTRVDYNYANGDARQRLERIRKRA